MKTPDALCHVLYRVRLWVPTGVCLWAHALPLLIVCSATSDYRRYTCEQMLSVSIHLHVYRSEPLNSAIS